MLASSLDEYNRLASARGKSSGISQNKIQQRVKHMQKFDAIQCHETYWVFHFSLYSHIILFNSVKPSSISYCKLDISWGSSHLLSSFSPGLGGGFNNSMAFLSKTLIFSCNWPWSCFKKDARQALNYNILKLKLIINLKIIII